MGSVFLQWFGFRLALLLAPSLLIGTAPAAARPDPPDSIVAGDLGTKLDEAVKKEPNFWGAVLVGRADEILLAKGYGDAMRKPDGTPNPITIRHYFDIASISKQFTACAILRLEMQGKLSIEDSIGKHLKAFALDDDVTIRHLLTHTSGWPGDPKLGPGYRETREGLAKAFAAALRVRPPGAGFEYQNQCYGLLAAIVEEVSGQKFEEFVKKELFERAGMLDTGFIPGTGLDKARETRRELEGQKVTTFKYYWDWDLRGCGGILSTISDFHKWDSALRGDAILDEARKKEFYTPALANYALGVRVEDDGEGGRTAEHSGGTRGYRAEYIRWLEKDVQIAVFTNNKGDPFAVSKRLANVVFGLEEPRVHPILSLGKRKRDEDRVVALGERVRWRTVRGEGGALTLSLHDDEHDDTPFSVEMNKSAAMEFAKGLRSAAAAQTNEGEKNGIEAVIYTSPYKVGDDGVLALPEGMVLVRVMPRYQGGTDDGKVVVDERLTLILMDEKNHFWPAIVKMSRGAVRALQLELENAMK